MRLVVFRREHMKKVKVLSLFDGISCGMIALERAGFEVEDYIAYEIEKSAISISKKNYPQIVQKGNVIGADFTQYEGFDIVMGGFPCQDISIGQYKGDRTLDSKRSGLFWELARAIKEVQPKYFLVENNYGIPKEVINTVSEVLGVQPVMIDSQLVSGQRRKRLYWTNIEGITQPEDKGIKFSDIVESGYVHTEKSYCLTANYNGAYPADLFKSVRSQVFEPAEKGKFEVRDEVVEIKGYNRVKGRESVKVKGVPDGRYDIRKLSVVECCRLQTVPENYFEGFGENESRKALGNGWTVDVIAHILSYAKDL